MALATKTNPLIDARQDAGLGQDEAAAYFGLYGGQRRTTFGRWEVGVGISRKRRAKFITYLSDRLGLKRDIKRMQLIWQEVMVNEWGWPPLRDDELPARKQDHLIKERGETYTHKPQEIPSSVPDFFGREDEIAKLVSSLGGVGEVQDASILCGIHGMGGVGKTQLACKVANRVKHLFPDG